MDWKNLLLLVLGALVPTLYSLITGALPGFPIDAETFGAFVVWIVGLLIGGWNMSSIYWKKKITG